MDSLLEKLLEKRGIQDINSLDEDERKELEKWQAILTKKEVRAEDMTTFCKAQLALIERQMDNLENTSQKNDRLVLLYSVYRKLYNILTVPKAERKALEAKLTAMIYEE